MKRSREVVLILFVLLLSINLFGQNAPQVIAHRGYWQKEGSAQNSISSLENAAKAQVYGSEFDVWMTKDSVLIIYHDAHIQGKLIDTLTYASIQNYELSNGEKIPTLREYLEAAKRFENIRLVLELKQNKHANPEWSREATRRSVELVQEKKLLNRTEYITFNLDAGKEFIRLLPEADVYYLNGELSPKDLKDLGFKGLDYHYNVLLNNPDWFTEAKKWGIWINVWTVNDITILQKMTESGADFITTDKPEETLEYLSTIYNKE